MIGIIATVTKDTVTFTLDNKDSCFGCMKQDCEKHNRYLTAKNSLSLPLNVGQKVEIENSKPDIIRQSLIALLPPFAGFIAGYVITGLIFPSSTDGARAMAGVLFFLAAGAVTYFIRKKFPESELPYVAKILTE